MAHIRRETFSGPYSIAYPSDPIHHFSHYPHHPLSPLVSAKACPDDLEWPFEHIDGIDHDTVRETAYEIFFTSCRSSPGFGGRCAPVFYSSNSTSPATAQGSGSGMASSLPWLGGVGVTQTSQLKRALGLKMIKWSPSKRTESGWASGRSSAPTSPSRHNSSSGRGDGMSSSSVMLGQTVPVSRARRPLTLAEIMRQQMRMTEQEENRLRKTLMRTLVGQTGRRAETIVLPLELLRHVKASEFSDSQEYHAWQKRQLAVLQAGLLAHPLIPLEKHNMFATRLQDIIMAGGSHAIDTGKNADTMRTLCNSVVSLAWRSDSGTIPTDACHWADGYPLNVHLYTALLFSVFDIHDETAILDEVDELFELMKKTWAMLGINRSIHNVCFTWALFHQYIATSETEPDLLYASYMMLSTEVSKDARRPNRDTVFTRVLSSVMSSMRSWSEKRLRHYHDYFQRGTVGLIENILPLALTASNIMGEDSLASSDEHVDNYIRSSLQNAFTKMLDTKNYKHTSDSKQEACEALLQLAQETEDLALKERECFSPIMKKWHPVAVGVAAVVLHNCYGKLLKQFLSGATKLTTETVEVLQRARELENFLVQMVVEDSTECEDGGKVVVREMIPYEVDSVMLKLLKQWIDDKLQKGRDCILRARETETWNPKSKTEPYAQSAVELMKTVKETVEDFFEIPVGITDDLIQDLVQALGQLFQDYTSFVASCGSKQSYIPSLPPLTRCHRDSKFIKLFKRAAPCSTIGLEERHPVGSPNEGNNPRPSTSRSTQRLYIRLNSLHYLLTYIHSLNKTLTLSPRITTSTSHFTNCRSNSSTYFDIAKSSIQAACQHVLEVAAYRLVFLDSNSSFYESLYFGGVTNARVRPVVRILKQNLALLCAMLTNGTQPLAIKEVMKVSFEAYLMVLLAGGNSRVFYRPDHKMIEEDFECLKRVFSTCSEGLISDEVIDTEAESVDGVIALMGQPTEQLIEEFSILTCEASGIGVMGAGQRLPMPPTTRRWHRSDPNTILRVLCHRNDRLSKQFLKKSFQLAKRK
ncbi:hypothetical protein SAY86_021014 [Trapa natans]|uniref:Uncharacterized protein n=1 Tax=Trapa natans TaxID=22666 RepID=A0AAN7MJP0_TRANT|nr:hypothetical protein SAY86_021014 [Trapa natans]